MKLLPPAMWLSAWCVWIWLGFGLHRELPRDWGPALCKLPKEFVGFVHHSDVVVCRNKFKVNEYVCMDARTGVTRFEPTRIAIEGGAGLVSLPHGLAVGLDFSAWIENARNDGLQGFRFDTGAWTKLNVKLGRIFDVHPNSPLVAVRLENGTRNAPRLAVVDAAAGKVLGIWEAAPPPAGCMDFLQECSFTGDGDEVVCWIERNAPADRGSNGVSHRFEHWSPTRGTGGPPVTLNRVVGRVSKAKRGRIVVMGFGGRTDSFEVLDHRTGESLLSNESTDLGLGGQRMTYPLDPVLSPSGRSVLGRSNCLWSVDDRRPLWRGQSYSEVVVSASPGASRFGVLEDWSWALKRLDISDHRWTFAIRDMETGAVVHRVWGTGPVSQDFSPAVRYALLKREGADPDDPQPEHVVVDATPNVNWTLLAICQAILALPIIMVWALLKWRRRAARRLPIEAAA